MFRKCLSAPRVWHVTCHLKLLRRMAASAAVVVDAAVAAAAAVSADLKVNVQVLDFSAATAL